jgi:FtsP/CotA-like multicopper oxidase with cupredoxin domain
MAITQAMATSFKVEILDGIHNFGVGVIRASTAADTFKIALYTSSATLSAATTAYTTSNEVVGTGYTAGGNTLVVSTVPVSSGTTAYLSFSNTSWSTASITARGAMIYNASQSNKCVAVLDFGSDKTSTAGTFTIVFPTADATDAIIRIA